MLSNLQELLERSIFHAIRELTVAEGYIPDINDFDVENVSAIVAEAERLSYEAAKVVIKDAKGFVIDIFGSSNNQVKGWKKVPRIVIDTSNFQPGILGGDTTPLYENVAGVFVKTSNPSLSSDFFVNVYSVSGTMAQQRILTAIISQALPRRGYIKTYLDPIIQFSGNMFIKFVASGNSPDLPEGVIEKYFSYEAVDLFESLPTTIITKVAGDVVDIVPITVIEYKELTTIL